MSALAATAAAANPDALPASTGELNEIGLALTEALDRIELLEGHVRALCSILDAPDLLGAAPQPGRGERYVRSRVAQVAAGVWGEMGVRKFAERLDEQRRRRLEVSDEDRLRGLVIAESRAMGADVLLSSHTGVGYRIEWRPTPDDQDGLKRAREARQRAERRLAAENGGNR